MDLYSIGSVREQSKHPPTPSPAIIKTKPKAKGGIQPESGSRSGQQPGSGSSEKESEDAEASPDDYENESEPKTQMSPTISPAILSSSECPPNSTSNATTTGSSSSLGESGAPDRDLVRQLAASHYHSYGTALGVTIGVGCCLLLLNLLIFLAIYHQKTHK